MIFSKLIDELWVNNEGLEVFGDEKGSKRDVVSVGRFHNNSYGVKSLKDGEKIFEAFKGVWEGSSADNLSFLVDDTGCELIFRDINTDVIHRLPPCYRSFSEIVPHSILPCGKGFRAPPTYSEWRDRGTDSSAGLIAQKKWSSCPSPFKILKFNHGYIIN